MHALTERAYALFYDSRFQWGLRVLLTLLLVGLCSHAFADDGKDLLAGTDTSLWATLNGSGKKYIYFIELIFAIAAYIKGKNLMVFSGVIAIAIFINVVLSIAGVSST